jgi:dephospho-CoA kinase
MKQNSEAEGFMVIGVTGGIGTGKSLFSRFLEEMGATVISADDIVYRLYQNDHILRNELSAVFGSEILKDGRVDRTRLSRIVFDNKELLSKLNQIVHKRVGEEMRKKIEEYSDKKAVVLDVPIPVKKDFIDLCDMVVVIKSPLKDRIQRVIDRSGITETEIRKRMDAQPTEQEYEDLADVIIVNDGNIPELRKKAEGFLNEINL